MPSQTKAASSFAGLMDSDSEQDMDLLPAVRSAHHGIGGQKPRARSTVHANKVTKPAHRGAGHAAASSTARQALKERNANSVRESKQNTKPKKANIVDDDPLDSMEGVAWSPPKQVASKSRAAKGKQGAKEDAQEYATAAKRSHASHRLEEDEDEDAQPEERWSDAEEEEAAGIDAYMDPVATYDEDMGEPSDDDGADNASLRKRLSQLTKRYEGLEARYKDLREVGVKEAERNYDRLRKQADENSTGMLA